ncbi:very-long-chain (3R)-3-hydroxyacyl- dehydratase 4 [Pelobates cultripes]|uniref:Very-long-chain (3R)-3-hydroxyacyl-CoA dehydratase n=1 Tax=Pelobates cultripes TaxID=61616 RepID=A0AAD1W8X6_PELCU|nr:very-long-chain (3R)-3-hydroxyacyl- dehydratase 4 [Pelobates cultripes]
MYRVNRVKMTTSLTLYYLLQFCGHSWIFTNMTARLLFFGKDSFADTFYTIGLVMQACQLLSALELILPLLGNQQHRFLPSFLQVTERLVILFVVITSQEEVQSKCVVCALFFLWNMWDVVRYSYYMLTAVGMNYPPVTWLKHTWWIPVYPLSVLAEVYTIYESLPYFESLGTYSFTATLPVVVSVHFPYILKVYMIVLTAGMFYICNHLFMERKTYLRAKSAKLKAK